MTRDCDLLSGVHRIRGTGISTEIKSQLDRK